MTQEKVVCPVCNGAGVIKKTGQHPSICIEYSCDDCQGTGVITMFYGSKDTYKGLKLCDDRGYWVKTPQEATE